MIGNRTFITATTVVVVFFLTFSGMRFALLDMTSNPKPRPRTVLNQSVKTASGSLFSANQDFTPAFDVLHEPNENHIPALTLSRICVKFFSNLTEYNHIRLPQGRSPPVC